MKTISNYQQAKKYLLNTSIEAKEMYPTDKSLVRQTINDYADYLSLSEHQRDLLSNYACKLHPKN